MFDRWLSSELSVIWAFLLSLANGILGLPPSELLSFKAAQIEPVSKVALLFAVLVFGSVVAGLLMFVLGRTLKTYPRAFRFAAHVFKFEKWPSISKREYFRAIFLGRLTPGVRSQVPIIAGFLGGSFRIFLWAHIIATLAWYGFWISLSKSFLLLTSYSEYQTVHVLGLLVISMVVVHAIRHFLPILRKIFQILRSQKP